MISNKGAAKKIEVPVVAILPQIGPVEKEEPIKQKDYVLSNLASYLSSLHFRNQVLYLNERFDSFKAMVEASWHGLSIKNVSEFEARQIGSISLMVRDNDFVAEIAWMGHGLQMWLQTLWFLSRSQNSDVVILDEPDIYLHPDLQRKLVRLIKRDFKQTIITTHSTEIMSDVEPENILVVNKALNKSKYLSTFPGVQRILSLIGSAHNICISRMLSSKRVLILEGKDIYILKRVHNILFPSSETPIDQLPIFHSNGWGGWNLAMGCGMAFEKTFEQEVKVFCIFDSDYNSEAEVNKRIAEAKERNINLHIWERKEIENYLFVPSAIERAVLKKARGKAIPSAQDIKNKLLSIFKSSFEDIVDSIASVIIKEQKGIDLKTARKQGRDRAKKRWRGFENKVFLVPGKTCLGQLFQWIQKEYKVSIGFSDVTCSLQADEIPIEMRNLVSDIESAK